MEIALQVKTTAESFLNKVLSRFAEEAEEWAGCLPALSKWEDEHLLDNPPAENLAKHKSTLDALIKAGSILQWASNSPDFPDKDTARMIAATMNTLRDDLQVWHGPDMDKVEADRILAGAFPDES